MNKTILFFAFAVIGSASNAQIVFTGANLSENFDTLASTGTTNTWTSNSTILGWYATQTAGTLSTYRADNGAGTTGALYSYGASGTSERALGSVASGTPQNFIYGARITNNAANLVKSIVVGYNGEQWRNGGNTTAQKLTFEYSLNATGINDLAATWTADTNLNFTGPVTGSTAAAVDGNTTGRVAINTGSLATVLTSDWNVGTDLWIRWTDLNDTGNDHGLAIDDVTFSATPVPEPASLSILGFGIAGILARRKKR